MAYILAGIDIGNSTTEAVIGERTETGKIKYLSYARTETTGMKGTVANIAGVMEALSEAAGKAGISASDIDQIRMNDAVPVIGAASMDTISETTITGSAMIGHNPDTPGGSGVASGMTVKAENMERVDKGTEYIVLINDLPYYDAAEIINKAVRSGYTVNGAIARSDDGVLIYNRLTIKIPVIDEVSGIDKIDEGILAALEVAPNGGVLKVLSNPYGIARLFGLSAEETRKAVPISRSLTGARSGVVLRSENASADIKTIPAGRIIINGSAGRFEAEVNYGAEVIMQAVDHSGEIYSVEGSENSVSHTLFRDMKKRLGEVAECDPNDLKIKDLFAADSLIPVKVAGGIAEEKTMENAVVVAAMVEAGALPMKRTAEKLSGELDIYVKVAGKEANMAIKGALTTPGSGLPAGVLDMGGGSTDAALTEDGDVTASVHLAGAGETVTMMINAELGLDDPGLAEEIKRYPAAKAESLLFLRYEDGTVTYLQEPLPPELFGRTVLVSEDRLIPLPRGRNLTMEKVTYVRREAKRKVFAVNAVRALKKIAPDRNIRKIGTVLMVGGSALDFEIPTMIAEELSYYGIVAGRADVLGRLGPGGAVAYGLLCGG